MMLKIPLRFIISLLGFYGCALIYSHRAGLSVAIVSMVKSDRNPLIQNISGSCIVNQTHHESDQNSGI